MRPPPIDGELQERRRSRSSRPGERESRWTRSDPPTLYHGCDGTREERDRCAGNSPAPDRRIPGPRRCSRSTRRADHSTVMRNRDARRTTAASSMEADEPRVGPTVWADDPGAGPGDGCRREDDPARPGPLRPGRHAAGGDQRRTRLQDLADRQRAGSAAVDVPFRGGRGLDIGRQFLEPLAGTPFWSSAHSAWRQVEAMLGETARAYIGPDERSGRAGRAGLTHMMNAVFGYRPILYRRGEMNCSEKPGQTESITIAPRGFSSARVPPKRRRDGRYRFRPDSGPAVAIRRRRAS